MSALLWFLMGLMLGGALGCVLFALMVVASARPLWSDSEDVP